MREGWAGSSLGGDPAQLLVSTGSIVTKLLVHCDFTLSRLDLLTNTVRGTFKYIGELARAWRSTLALLDSESRAIPAVGQQALAQQPARNAHRPARLSRPRAGSLRLEPLVGLEWSRALELAGGPRGAKTPADHRRAWVHRAPEAQVVALFRAVNPAHPRTDSTRIDAPWWLRALAAGRLGSRAEGFAIEDEVAELLTARAGWVYACWGGTCEDGCWEYMPSESGPDGPRTPAVLSLTARHGGWLDAVPAHGGAAPEPIAVAGVAELSAALDEFER